MDSEGYLKEAIRVSESHRTRLNIQYPTNRKTGQQTPFGTSLYRPELENSRPCNEEEHGVYMNLIGVLRWICEIGRIDILLEVSLLSQYMAQPRYGHLQHLFNIFRYLQHHGRSWIVLDPTNYEIDWEPKNREPSPWERAKGMQELYRDVDDPIPPKMPEPRGKPVSINAFVDADHAGNQMT